jgi:two-component system sensor histidine kinase/response regulator
MTEENVIDRTALHRLLESLGDDRDFFAELLGTYFDDSPQQIAAMQAALAAGKAEDLRRAAHSLKSNSKNFGALVLAEKCKELEEMGKAGVLDGAAGHIALVAAEYEKARAALEAIQKGG